ncbi:MAG: hypothetical protein HY319_05835 [Armatimonadetes bacterium]|nr:hypothetical protein [Armatimonadota bacterium]
MTQLMKGALAVVIVALSALGFYLVDWQKKQQDLAQLDFELEQRAQKLASVEAEIKSLPDLTREVERLEAELQSLMASRFAAEHPDLFVANTLGEIERLVESLRRSTGDADFSVISVSPGALTSTQVAEEETADALPGVPARVFQLEMTGRYKTLVDFLYRLGALELDRPVTVGRINLSPKGGTGADAPVLSVSIPLTAYLRGGE